MARSPGRRADARLGALADRAGDEHQIDCRRAPDPRQADRVEPGQLSVHADRGSSMTSNPVTSLYAFLGNDRSH